MLISCGKRAILLKWVYQNQQAYLGGISYVEWKCSQTSERRNVGSCNLCKWWAECGSVAFKDVTDDGKLLVGDVFLETTLNNIQANDGKIAISVCNEVKVKGAQQWMNQRRKIDMRMQKSL